MRTKQGQDYCIACIELDTDADKDDPGLQLLFSDFRLAAMYSISTMYYSCKCHRCPSTSGRADATGWGIERRKLATVKPEASWCSTARRHEQRAVAWRDVRHNLEQRLWDRSAVSCKKQPAIGRRRSSNLPPATKWSLRELEQRNGHKQIGESTERQDQMGNRAAQLGHRQCWVLHPTVQLDKKCCWLNCFSICYQQARLIG